jgi:hypothetical protein
MYSSDIVLSASCPVPFIWFETAKSSSALVHSLMTTKVHEGGPLLCSLCKKEVTNHPYESPSELRLLPSAIVELASQLPKPPCPDDLISTCAPILNTSQGSPSPTVTRKRLAKGKSVTQLLHLERFYEVFKRNGTVPSPSTSRRNGNTNVTIKCTGLTTIDPSKRCFLHFSPKEQQKLLGVNLQKASIRSFYNIACAVEGIHFNGENVQQSWLTTAKSIITKYYEYYNNSNTVSIKILREVRTNATLHGTMFCAV